MDNEPAHPASLPACATSGTADSSPVVPLTPLETRVLQALQSGDVVSRYDILELLYPNEQRGYNLISVVVLNLRRKGHSIETIWGKGYRLTSDERIADRALTEAGIMPVSHYVEKWGKE